MPSSPVPIQSGFQAPECTLARGAIDNGYMDTWGIGVITLRLALGKHLWESNWLPVFEPRIVEDHQAFRLALQAAVKGSVAQVHEMAAVRDLVLP